MRTKARDILKRVDHYREEAEALRQRAQMSKSLEARDDLHALAADYERLADFVQANRRGKTRAHSKKDTQN